MSVTTDRLASLIQRELASIVNTEVKDKSFGYINLTEVKVTKDVSYATVYYTILSDEPEIIDKAKEAIDKSKQTIRMELAKKIRNIRKIPDLIFKYDEALAYGNNIDKILKTIK
ncbi:30S ribosome-binding factor RbfA [Peloplasma aerotolerans]|jgi:ribosome-binding factor A|uniref:Ribosome-binding factor A n=1 Tax=Peloplasma aerotolerans TaxID=3044389 RepID=A0AAW6UAD9_9MOLU|nr:30S ribosome-binding factor RbfA [Mariniplasma sp. M4Ah]MDI6453402.1 30S ribosome-binding factor RbfA [Mariniplasma sp. M4Ah]MDR4968290.1 30S ribosome-binding factor RbfA [Acholeplasmataceae bacterium]